MSTIKYDIYQIKQGKQFHGIRFEGTRFLKHAQLLLGLDREKDKKKMYQSTKIPKTVYRKYFTGKQEHEISEVITKALEQYFANK